MKIIKLIFLALLMIWFNTYGNGFKSIFKLKKEIKLEQNNKVFIGFLRKCFIDENLIVITDPKMHDVKVYDMLGQLKKVIGEKGKGPGEFQIPMGITANNDYIFISDIGNGRLNIFNRANFTFVKSFPILDGREVRIWNNKIFLSYVDMEMKKGLHIFTLDGKNIMNCINVPKITLDNQLISDGTSFDIDSKGNIYFVNEMQYEVLRSNSNCETTTLINNEKNKYYRAPPKKPIQDIYSRKKIANWANSWTHVLKIIALEKQQRLLVYTSDNKYGKMLNIYSVSGKLMNKNIKTDMRLLCSDREGNIYFLKETMNGNSIEFIIKQYEINKN